MEAKKTKGKQKREMKKIEDEKYLSIAFSKRKSGIHKKASELTAISAAKLDVLMFSPAGKPFCYGNPSLQSTKRTSLNEENPSEDSVVKIMEAQKRVRIEQVNNENDTILDQMYVEEEREQTLGELLKARNNRGWWETKNEDINYVKAKEIDVLFDELKKNLLNELSIRDEGVDSHAFVPIDQTNGPISNPSNACGSNNTYGVIFETNNQAYGIGAIFGPANQTSGVISNPTNACGSNNIHEVEAYGIGASKNNQLDFSAVNQMNGVNSNLTYAGSSNCHESKGKQKQELKKIKDKKALTITFRKRKSCIMRKAYELTATCDTKLDVLMFSPTGKPLCYGNPSLQSTKRTSLNEENHLEDSIEKTMEARKRIEVEEINSKNETVLDQMYVEEEREKTLGGILKARNKRGWWETKTENINYVEAKKIDAFFDEFKKNLVNALSIKDGGVASHGQTSRDISNPTNACESINTSEVVFENNNQAHGIAASGNDISEVVNGANNGIGSSMNYQPNFASIYQMNEVNANVTHASGKNKATQI